MNDIPEPIRDVFEQLKNEITSLHARWKIYRQLFAHSDERIRLLNTCAPTFFFFIHGVLIDEIQLSLGKLTDPARTGRFDNLSLKQLQKQVDDLGDQRLSTKLRDILLELCGDRNNPDTPGKCEAIKTRRDKRIAHLDLNSSIQLGGDPLPGISRQMIEDALGLVRKYMNTIEDHYCQSEYRYHDPIIGPYDGEALVACLRDGLDFRQLAEKLGKGRTELRSGKWSDA
jgi:hypothetical protein